MRTNRPIGRKLGDNGCSVGGGGGGASASPTPICVHIRSIVIRKRVYEVNSSIFEKKKGLELKCNYSCHRNWQLFREFNRISFQGGRGKIKDGCDSYEVLTYYKSQDPLFWKAYNIC